MTIISQCNAIINQIQNGAKALPIKVTTEYHTSNRIHLIKHWAYCNKSLEDSSLSEEPIIDLLFNSLESKSIKSCTRRSTRRHFGHKGLEPSWANAFFAFASQSVY